MDTVILRNTRGASRLHDEFHPFGSETGQPSRKYMTTHVPGRLGTISSYRFSHLYLEIGWCLVSFVFFSFRQGFVSTPESDAPRWRDLRILIS